MVSCIELLKYVVLDVPDALMVSHLAILKLALSVSAAVDPSATKGYVAASVDEFYLFSI
ncbi:TPA: hypothetical protein ACVO3J_002024 [Vibrio alginolyticus]|uniref:hypothetical protein n=1 Tax=Vibrio TaxID=662 RepID=UPI000AE55548|nr:MULTISPECIES: hypothetical protein [Vibrio]EGQ8469583.1 hypothetical protein [Vibrio alginolyticus]EJL6748271.1 hypothetical protein [Vibrio alginolyticus]EJL6854911.1 hypothetical protein [Vibrio alginolyticus]EJL8713701.1 hypothetical protein [Vibrio alginolyticus]EKY4204180.1 hypothetical protein [Vibrio alginolyticus]